MVLHFSALIYIRTSAYFLLDIDECSRENNCSVDSTCNDTVGSYDCTCFPGYQDEGIGYICTGMCINVMVNFVGK